jgi:hypothetical protein
MRGETLFIAFVYLTDRFICKKMQNYLVKHHFIVFNDYFDISFQEMKKFEKGDACWLVSNTYLMNK